MNDSDGFYEMVEGVMRIALCHKYQKMYTDIKTLCEKCNIYGDEVKEINRWKYNGGKPNLVNLQVMYDYIKENEEERFKKSMYWYTIDYYSKP